MTDALHNETIEALEARAVLARQQLAAERCRRTACAVVLGELRRVEGTSGANGVESAARSLESAAGVLERHLNAGRAEAQRLRGAHEAAVAAARDAGMTAATQAEIALLLEHIAERREQLRTLLQEQRSLNAAQAALGA